MADTFYVRLTLNDALNAVDHAVVNGSITGELIDRYILSAPGGGSVAVLVYESTSGGQETVLP